MKILVTGGSGFIGVSLVRHLIDVAGSEVVNVDKLTYAATPGALETYEKHSRYRFERADICDAAAMNTLLQRHEPDAVVHLAAESHVDRSIDAPAAFVQTNVVGTFTILEAVQHYWSRLPGVRAAAFRFLHVSTDEVFGSLGDTGTFSEASRYDPNSPYAATKAASDHLVRAWHRTYGVPVVITNCSNNFGPYQFPEKLIPLTILSAIEGRPIPVYGDGRQVRDWLFVDDHARALDVVLQRGEIGSTYNIGGGNERANIDVVRLICSALQRQLGHKLGDFGRYEDLITYVPDRPGHDRRYAIDSTKVRREIGWSPQESFESAIQRTVTWYLSHLDWVDETRKRGYRGERLGMIGAGAK
ncbi:MAG: dTDP-glucose 4,6-dehydratase [Gemmatimonadetes bacterium]|nr:dTDP-glucose 4,6-dehydratase [Gemmatimonadota bacterium]